MEMFIRTLLHINTNFTIKKVYKYDTYPAYPIISRNESGFEEEWQEKFEDVFNRFKKNLEYVLKSNNLMDNKIAVQIEYQIPSFRQGCVGTILWCHKDWTDGFFFGCYPNSYVKDGLNISFHI